MRRRRRSASECRPPSSFGTFTSSGDDVVPSWATAMLCELLLQTVFQTLAETDIKPEAPEIVQLVFHSLNQHRSSVVARFFI